MIKAEWTNADALDLQPTCNQLATDCISRQAAIDTIDKILPVEPMKNEYTQGITCGAALAMEYVKQLPSAQPELIAQDAYVRGFEQGRTQGKVDADLQQKRKKGYWTLYDKRFPWLHDYKCSQCGRRLSFSGLSSEAKFCPYCGAKMEGILNG